MWPFRKHDIRDELDERLRRYASQKLPQRLHLPSSTVGSPTIGQFARGSASHLRYVELEGHGKVVLRAFLRKRHLRRLAGYARLHELLGSRQIPVPRLLFVDDSAATRRTYGFWVLAEEFLEGHVLADVPAEARLAPLLSLADVLARLHGIRRSVPGKPWEGEHRKPGRWARRKCVPWLERAERLGLSRARSRALVGWFPEQFRALGRGEFPLVHGDPHPGNLLVTPDGRPHLLDLASFAYWFPQVDLFIAQYWVNDCAPGQVAEFLDRYFLASGAHPALSREEYQASHPLIGAWLYLRLAAGYSRRALRQKDRGQPGWEALAREARDLWAETQDFLRLAGAP